MRNPVQPVSVGVATDRRSFLKKGVVTAGSAAVGAGLLGNGLPVFAKDTLSSLCARRFSR
jgi:hypothetical protein